MRAIRNQPHETSFYLSLTGAAATGITYDEVTVKYKKYFSESFSTKTLEAEDWVELGDGFYMLKWSAVDMDTAGSFMYTMTSAKFDDFLYDLFEVRIPGEPFTVPGKCVVRGNIQDLGINPATGLEITARPTDIPGVAGTALLSGEPIRTVPAANGDFSLALGRGLTVRIDIPMAGIRHQIEVPDTEEAVLLDLLPPIT